jgi:hypothetical protein
MNSFIVGAMTEHGTLGTLVCTGHYGKNIGKESMERKTLHMLLSILRAINFYQFFYHSRLSIFLNRRS